LAEARRANSFGRARRLSGSARFAEIYDANIRYARGPLIVYSLPNALSQARMGISISRKTAAAAQRNAIKRRIREAFRQLPLAKELSLDLVIVVRRHPILRVLEYQQLLRDLMQKAGQHWRDRGPAAL
jgi:ribonuclease P protein component